MSNFQFCLPSNFPKWHFGMLNDVVRNNAMERSIKKCKPQGKVVFEIGSGTGIVAMLFAKYGATHVYTCETDENMFQIARALINESEYSERITVLFGHSSKTLSKIRKAIEPDIIFTETLDCGVVGEGFYEIKQNILNYATKSTKILPVEVLQNCVLLESDMLDQLNRVDSAVGFDVSLLNKYRTRTYFPVHSELYECKYLSVPKLMKKYRLDAGQEFSHFSITASKSGICHGILSWFEVDFGGHSVSTHPHSGSHWHQAFHPFDIPEHVSRGKQYDFSIGKDGCVGTPVKRMTMHLVNRQVELGEL